MKHPKEKFCVVNARARKRVSCHTTMAAARAARRKVGITTHKIIEHLSHDVWVVRTREKKRRR